MKKKLVITCLLGMIALGMSACGDKKLASDTEETTQAFEGENVEAEAAENSDETQSPDAAEKVSERADYIAIQDLDIDTYVTLPDYRNMTVSAYKPEITDEDIKSVIDDEYLTVKLMSRAVKEGDIVDIDYVGKKDGVAFSGGTANGYQLQIGSGAFIDGFEDGLIGVMPGDTVDLNLTFPENYGSTELAGADVVFTVTVNGIVVSADYETVTDEDLAELGIDMNREELWAAGTALAEEYAEDTFRSNANSAILTRLGEECTITSVPDYLVEEEVQNYNLYMESVCQSYYGTDLETFVSVYYGMTMEDYAAELTEMSQDTVKQYLILEAVARAEGIEITQEQISKAAEEEAAVYGYASGDELVDEVGYTTYRMYMMQDLVLERLNEIINVEETASETAE